jgi:anti-anti-sigma factor
LIADSPEALDEHAHEWLVVTRKKLGDSAEIIALAGELDLGTAPTLESALGEIGSAARPAVIDLTEITFIDSYGLHTLLRHIDAEHVTIIVPQESVVRRVLELTCADRALSLAETLDRALVVAPS